MIRALFAVCILSSVSLVACARQPSTAPAAVAAAGTTVAAGMAAAPAPGAPTAADTTPTLPKSETSGESGDRDATPSLERLTQLSPDQQLPGGRWKAGVNYKPVVPTQPTNAAAGKVEVVEVFWYGCSHCYALDPYLESWRKNKAAYIDFVRVPVIWGPVHKAHARLFYTLQALGKLEQLHTKVFDEIHQHNNMLVSVRNDEAETRSLQLAFAKANGIAEKDFLQAYDSMGVDTNLKRAEDFTHRYAVEGVPLIVVNGKYTTDVGMAGGPSPLLQLINDLAAAEKRR